jgi:hypothetical protein
LRRDVYQHFCVGVPALWSDDFQWGDSTFDSDERTRKREDATGKALKLKKQSSRT